MLLLTIQCTNYICTAVSSPMTLAPFSTFHRFSDLIQNLFFSVSGYIFFTAKENKLSVSPGSDERMQTATQKAPFQWPLWTSSIETLGPLNPAITSWYIALITSQYVHILALITAGQQGKPAAAGVFLVCSTAIGHYDEMAVKLGVNESSQPEASCLRLH